MGSRPSSKVFVVEVDRGLVRLMRIRGPLQDLLCPVHAHVVVHPALFQHLALRGVPKFIVCLGALEFRASVEKWTAIRDVLGERLLSPRLGALEVVVFSMEANEIDGQFTPGDELIEIGLLVGGRCVGFFDSESDGNWTDVAEVQVRRERTGAVDFRMIALRVVVTKRAGRELLEQAQSFGSASAKTGYGRNRAIKGPVAQDIEIGRKRLTDIAAGSMRASPWDSCWGRETRPSARELRAE